MNALELQTVSRKPIAIPSTTYTNLEELFEEIKEAHEGGFDQMAIHNMPEVTAHELSKYWFYHVTPNSSGAYIVKWRGYERWLVTSGGADSRVCAELGVLALYAVAEKHPKASKAELVKF